VLFDVFWQTTGVLDPDPDPTFKVIPDPLFAHGTMPSQEDKFFVYVKELQQDFLMLFLNFSTTTFNYKNSKTEEIFMRKSRIQSVIRIRKDSSVSD
jgi:hypothetical protein